MMDKTCLVFFVSSDLVKILKQKLKRNIEIANNAKIIFLCDEETYFSSLKEITANNDNHFFIQDSLYAKNCRLFNNLKNFFKGRYVNLTSMSKKGVNNGLFDFVVDLTNVVEFVTLLNKISLLEHYISVQDARIVDEKKSLATAIYSHLDNIRCPKLNFLDVDLYFNYGKRILSNIFWYGYDHEKRFVFIDFIFVNKNLPDYIPWVIIKDWQMFFGSHCSLSSNLKEIPDLFVKCLLDKYTFIKEEDIGFFYIVSKNCGEYIVSSKYYSKHIEISVGNKKYIVAGSFNIADVYKKMEQEESIHSLKKRLEEKIYGMDNQTITDVNQYAFIFEHKKKPRVQTVEGTYDFCDKIYRTGLIKIFELRDLENIIEIIVEKINSLYQSDVVSGHNGLIHNIKLVLREIIINSIEHGIKHNVCGNVFLHYYMGKDKIIFAVEDSGVGFNPKNIRDINRQSRRGKGLYIVNSIVDKIFFNRKGNLVRIEFNLKKWRKKYANEDAA